jgi:putative tricarboxylic transport membrane protein
MRRGNIVAALGLAGLAGYLFFEAGKLRFGTARMPQTGFFPKTLLALLLVLSLVLLGQALRQSDTGRAAERIPAEGWIRIGATMVILVGFALVLEKLGFLLSTFLLMVLLLRAIEAPKWSKVIAVAISTAVLSYILFGWLLGIPLPGGILGL